ncbi:MAG: hypothetical protein L0207_07025 [Chlamydiae bacterium]|nr:hypothetical protein [Chlamydiota bacterium]
MMPIAKDMALDTALVTALGAGFGAVWYKQGNWKLISRAAVITLGAYGAQSVVHTVLFDLEKISRIYSKIIRSFSDMIDASVVAGITSIGIFKGVEHFELIEKMDLKASLFLITCSIVIHSIVRAISDNDVGVAFISLFGLVPITAYLVTKYCPKHIPKYVPNFSSPKVSTNFTLCLSLFGVCYELAIDYKHTERIRNHVFNLFHKILTPSLCSSSLTWGTALLLKKPISLQKTFILSLVLHIISYPYFSKSIISNGHLTTILKKVHLL